MVGGSSAVATIALAAHSDFVAVEVLTAITREHADIAGEVSGNAVCLRSPIHSADELMALWWATAANQALLARAAGFRPQMIKYLLS
jgi:hypothetical protein